MMARGLLFFMPIIAFLSNVFSVNNLPEGILAMLLLLLLVASLIDNQRSGRVKVNFAGKLMVSALLIYTMFSASYVFMVDSDVDIKRLTLLLLSFSGCIWFILSSCFVRDQIELNFHAFCKGVMLVSIVYLFMVATVFMESYSGRSWAVISNNTLPKRNDISLFFLVGLCGYFFLDFGLTLRQKSIACTIVAMAIIFSFSRSAYLALLAATIYFTIKSKRKVWLVLVLAACSVLFLRFEDNPVLDRIQYTYSDDGYDDSTSGRIIAWQYAINLAEKSPVFGVGSGRSPFWDSNENALHGSSLKFAHNYFITQLYQLGIVGLVLTLLMFLMFLILAKKLEVGAAQFSFSVLMCFIIMSISGEPMYGYSQYIFLALYSALINERVSVVKQTNAAANA